MDELIKHGFIPDIDHSARFESRSQSMRPKSSQCDGQEAKHSRDSKKSRQHPA